MLYIANGILKDPFQAEDAVLQTFIKIIDKLQYFSFENCNKTRALLSILMKDLSIKHYLSSIPMGLECLTNRAM